MATSSALGLGEVERRHLIFGCLRAALSTGLLVSAYYFFPLHTVTDTHRAGYDALAIVRLGVAAAVFLAVLALEIRSIRRSRHPMLRAGVAMAVVIPLFLIVFAWTYVTISRAQPNAFNIPLSRTDALYFAVTVFSTVGFGDIVPHTDTTRLLVTGQMIADLIVIAVVVRLLIGVGQETKRSAEAAQAELPSDEDDATEPVESDSPLTPH